MKSRRRPKERGAIPKLSKMYYMKTRKEKRNVRYTAKGLYEKKIIPGDVRHRAKGLHTKQDIEKEAHTRIPPTPPFRFVFCVSSFITGSLLTGADKEPPGSKA
jgi:hypothetical protein